MEGQRSSYSFGEVSLVDQHNAGSTEASSIYNEHDAMNSTVGQPIPDLNQVYDEPVEQGASSSSRVTQYHERNIRRRTGEDSLINVHWHAPIHSVNQQSNAILHHDQLEDDDAESVAALSITIPFEPPSQVPVDITDFPQPQLPQPNGIDRHSSAASHQSNSLVIPIWNPITNVIEYPNPAADAVNRFRLHRHSSNRYQPALAPSPVARRMQHVRAREGRRRQMTDRQLDNLRHPIESNHFVGLIMGGITEEILELRREETGHVRTTITEDHILPHLEQRKHKPNEPGFPTPDEHCCICQEQYVAGEDITRLDCRHDYHVQCITKWLMHNNSCPLCKATGLAALE